MATESQTTHLNALANASSAYLRSAMHQPIRWFEWGTDAFAAAKGENKPILLDIGAVWCHWCHVMDRESYEDAETARIINENFIAMKVDRDERPEVDSRYQAAVGAISGQGGWPLTAFLTSDGKPFYGGTYFPSQEHYGRPSFKRVLLTMAQAFKEKHGEVMESAEKVMRAISHAEGPTRPGTLDPVILRQITESGTKLFDAKNGGFGDAPKFPHPSALDLLLDRFAKSGDEQLAVVTMTTLAKMATGGVYDQLAGGFHRYSVDEGWVVPHFEKMSYDNSELLKNYVHGYQVSGNEFFAAVAQDIVRWVNEWLSDRDKGGFYASQDADINLDDDGDYFTWTVEEARAVLNDDEWKVAELYYDIGEIGEMHHNPKKNVLHVRSDIATIAKKLGIPEQRAGELHDSAKLKMYAARLKRPTPFVDKTVYVSWNAMMTSAYLEGAKALGAAHAREFALRSLDRVLAEAWSPEQGLAHVIAYADEQVAKRRVDGVLDDYAFTAIACLDAYEATGALSYFSFARKIADAMIERFYDRDGGGFFDTSQTGGAEPLGALTATRKPLQDSPTPAGNSAAAIGLLRLHAYSNEPKYREIAEGTLAAFAGVAGQYGIFAGTYGIALSMFFETHTQVVVIGSGEAADRLYAAAVAPFSLNKAVLRISGENEVVPQNLPPALAETLPHLPAVKNRETVAIICSGFACQPPISDPDELERTLRAALRKQ